jgi:hypothetical protein
MWTWIAEENDVDRLLELATEARDSLANPFTSRWGREHAEYLLHDVNERLDQLIRTT